MFIVTEWHFPTTLNNFFLQTQHISLFLIANSSSGDWVIGSITLRSREIDLLAVLISAPLLVLYNFTQCLKYLFQLHGFTRVSMSLPIR